jgi:hypothetical protein
MVVTEELFVKLRQAGFDDGVLKTPVDGSKVVTETAGRDSSQLDEFDDDLFGVAKNYFVILLHGTAFLFG